MEKMARQLLQTTFASPSLANLNVGMASVYTGQTEDEKNDSTIVTDHICIPPLPNLNVGMAWLVPPPAEIDARQH